MSAKFTDIWHVIGLRGTGSDSYAVSDLFVPEKFTVLRDTASIPRAPGLLYAFSSSNIYASGFAGWRSASPAALDLCRTRPRQDPRGAGISARQQCDPGSDRAVRRARRRPRLSASSLDQIWRDAAASGHLTPITIRPFARLDLGHPPGARGRRPAYHAAGATAIFEANLFERRFRDIHTVVQQYQGRQAHFETVGQVLLGLEPEGAMFTF